MFLLVKKRYNSSYPKSLRISQFIFLELCPSHSRDGDSLKCSSYHVISGDEALVFLFFYFFLFFLGPHPWHMEVPRLRVKLELQLLAYATATATLDPSCVCNLYHSSWKRRILNPLIEARDGTCILMDAGFVNRWATMGTPGLTFSSIFLFCKIKTLLSAAAVDRWMVQNEKKESMIQNCGTRTVIRGGRREWKNPESGRWAGDNCQIVLGNWWSCTTQRDTEISSFF